MQYCIILYFLITKPKLSCPSWDFKKCKYLSTFILHNFENRKKNLAKNKKQFYKASNTDIRKLNHECSFI